MSLSKDVSWYAQYNVRRNYMECIIMVCCKIMDFQFIGVNTFSPNINNQILQTALHIFP